MPLSRSICVIGSSNTDMVVKTEKLPVPGETVLGGQFLMNPGGKGANQAVAAARLGGQVTFVAKVGNDLFGQQAVQQFRREKINTEYVITDPDQPSGVALINVDAGGENCIAVAPGANGTLTPEDVEAALDTRPALVLLQLEIPLPTVEHVIRRSHEKGLRVVLNPAPAQALPADLLASLYLITPNETEAERLTGIRVTDPASAERAARQLRDQGVQNVIITLGAKGAYLLTDSVSKLIATQPVTAVDTTAAGDCFNGALVVALAEDQPWEAAVPFACRAASLSVTRLGAQASMPFRTELHSTPFPAEPLTNPL